MDQVAAGFSLAADVSDKDDGWAREHLLPTWPYSKAMAVEQSNALGSGDFDCVTYCSTKPGPEDRDDRVF
jgi:hypothetical protein